MSIDFYAWKGPRDVEPEEAAALVSKWQDDGGDPASSPFEPDSDVAWFYRELVRDAPGIELSSDAVPETNRRPIWLQTENAPPARVVVMHLAPGTPRDSLGTIFALAVKYDLVLFDPHGPHIRSPLADMAAYADATFWPHGAIRAFVAGAVGLVMLVVAWLLNIIVVSWAIGLVGAFLLLTAVITFAHDALTRLRRRRPTAG